MYGFPIHFRDWQVAFCPAKGVCNVRALYFCLYPLPSYLLNVFCTLPCYVYVICCAGAGDAQGDVEQPVYEETRGDPRGNTKVSKASMPCPVSASDFPFLCTVLFFRMCLLICLTVGDWGLYVAVDGGGNFSLPPKCHIRQVFWLYFPYICQIR